MAKFILNRLFYSIFTILLVSVAVFVISHLSGDPVYLMVPPEAKVRGRREVTPCTWSRPPAPDPILELH